MMLFHSLFVFCPSLTQSSCQKLFINKNSYLGDLKFFRQSLNGNFCRSIVVETQEASKNKRFIGERCLTTYGNEQRNGGVSAGEA